MPPVNRSWVLGGLLVAAGVGLVRGLTGSRVRLTQNSRILLLGDSMAQGLGPQIKALATDVRLPYLGYGIPGTRLETWANSQWLDDALTEFQPTMTLVSLGTNDAYEATPDLWAKKRGLLTRSSRSCSGSPIATATTRRIWFTGLGARSCGSDLRRFRRRTSVCV